MNDHQLAIKLAADASELKRAQAEGAAGFGNLVASGEKAAVALAKVTDASDKLVSSLQAELAAIRQAAAANTADAAARAAVVQAMATQRTAQTGLASSTREDAAARKAAADALRAQQQAMRDNRAETNLLKQANRQLAMQMTDVVTSISSGMPVWMVAIQQGGQIRDAYGGVTPALRAMLGMLTPTVVAVGALATVAGVAALAFNRGWAESKAFSDGMALTGNTAALTEGRFNSLVGTLADARNTSAGVVRDLLQVLATGGEQTGATLDASARAALAMSRVNGQTAAETAASFAGMGDSVANWAAKANKAYNYLTAEQFKQIMALEAQGRTSEAMRLNMEALAATMESRNVRSLGYLEEALKSASTWWGNFWDAAKGIGRAETIDDQIAALERRIAGMDAFTRKGGYGGNTAFKDASAELEALQRERARGALREADKAAAQAAEQEAIIKASRGYQDSLLSIQAAGDAVLLAQQTAGFTARKAQADQAYAELRISGERYRDEMIAIERARIAAQEEAARKAIAIESARVVKTEQEVNARTAAVISAQARLAALAGERAKLAADIAGGRFDPKARSVLESPQAAFRSAELAAGGQVEAQIRAQAEATLALARAQADYVRNLQQTNAARGLANGRDLAGRRMGDGARNMAGREAAITDQFNQERERLEADLANNKVGRATFEARLAALRAYYDQALQQEADYQEQRLALEANANVGFDRALANYAEQSRDVAEQSERAWTRAFSGMEDAIVRFATTGKLSFSDLANSIIADLIRIYLRQQLTGLFGMGADMLSFWRSGGSEGFGNGAPMGGTGGVFHGGGKVGTDAPMATRWMPASTWANAPRLHTGRLQGNEMAAILQKDESVLTPAQMRQLAPAGRGGQQISLNLSVINQTGTAVNATARQTQGGDVEVLLTAAETAIAGNVSMGRGEVYSAFKARFNLSD